jgi:integrase/recombinase XerD
VEWMASQGYAVRNVYRRVPILCHFAEFAKLHGSTDLKSASTLTEEFALHWLASHGSQCTALEARCKITEEARNPVRQMLRLALEGTLPLPVRASHSLSRTKPRDSSISRGRTRAT